MPIKLRHKIDFFKGEGLGIITQKKDWHLKFSAKKRNVAKNSNFFAQVSALPTPIPPPQKNHLCTWIKHISQVTVNVLLINSHLNIDVKLLPIYWYIYCLKIVKNKSYQRKSIMIIINQLNHFSLVLIGITEFSFYNGGCLHEMLMNSKI